MRFLNPGIFNFLWAAALPLILHLISRTRTKKVKFSTVRFIKELERDTIKRFRIKQWLLVLIRTLIIIFLVFAFARPVSEGFVPEWMANTDASGVVLIDNSASMAAKVQGLTNLDRLKEAAGSVLAGLDRELSVSIYQTTPLKLIYEGGNYPDQVRKNLFDISQAHGSDDIWNKLRIILTNESKENASGIECFIFSDFETLPREDNPFNSRGNGQDSLLWRFYLFPGGKLLENNSVRAATPESRIHQSNHLFRLNARIVNDGTTDSRQVPIQMYVNDERVGQVVSTLEKGRTKDFLFQAYPGNENIIKGRIQLPEDDFAPDNVLTFDIPLASSISCKLVGRTPEDMMLIELALKSIDENNELLFLDTQAAGEIKRLYLDDYDVLILHNPGIMSKEAIGDIQNFIQDGGGVIWFAGDGQGDIAGKRGDLALNLPVYNGDSGFRGDGYYTLNLKNDNHALLTDLDLRDIKNELPIIYRFVDSRNKPDHNVVLSMNNEKPFLVECPSNTGSIMYFTSIVDMKWNDLALRGLFVPLLHRIIQYLATDENNTSPVTVDSEKTVHIEKELLKNEWTLVSPSGKIYTLVPDYNREVVVINDTDELGRYSLLADGIPYTSFSTVLASDEYPSKRIEIDKVPAVASATNVKVLIPDGNLQKKIQDIRLGKALWRPFFIAMLILLMLEMILGMVKKDTLKNNVRINGKKD